MTKEDFYKFEESAGNYPIGGSSEKSKCTPVKVFVGFLLVALAAALIAVVIYYNTGDRKTKLQADIPDSAGQGSATTTTLAPSTLAPSTLAPSTEEELLQRIDCIPEAKGQYVNVSEELCRKRNCIFDGRAHGNDAPSCYFSTQKTGYAASNCRDTVIGFKCDLHLKGQGPFGPDLDIMEFEVQMLGDDIIRFKFDDPLFHRYQVPIPLNLPSTKGSNPKYEIRITNNETFAFQITRKSTNKVLWDTGVGGLVLSDQFLQVSTRLPSKNVYGFGENLHKSFRHDLNFKTWPMFSRDQAPGWTPYSNLYGVHPFYTCLEDDGNSHGVFLFNSNAQDYSFTPLPMLTYRTIGGILDFYMFLGPEPEAVVQQYTGVIGRPYMPPYWSLGFQMCRYGYKSLGKLQEAVNRTKQYNIPHDVQYADIDHMHKQMDFTIDDVAFSGLPEYFEHLREGGMKTIIILDPTLITNVSGYEPYDNLTDIEGAIKWPEDYNAPAEDRDDTNAVLGYVWPEWKVVFPDFFKDSVHELWKRLILKHRTKIPFDALWIDMNEPANFGTNEDKPWNWPEGREPVWSLKCPQNDKYEDPPYRTKAAYLHDGKDVEKRISDKTICMVSRQGNKNEYQHYDVHSLYGWSQTKPTLDAVREATGERSLVLTRSTYPSSGEVGGHWLGDNNSEWPHLAESIIGMLEFNLFGIPYIGADICGFFGNTTVELCKRWMQLGAFYPFSRNHNGIDFMEQDPGFFGEEVAHASREALETRYWLLPYLYTLFHRAHKDGHTVVRPLFHEFPQDPKTYGIDRQFLWGPALVIVPILEQGQTKLDFYLPESAKWYDFYTGSSGQDLNGDISTPVTPDSKIGLFLRAGYILPMQEPANNTHYSRQKSMKLLIALDNEGKAEGELFWDDGNSVDTYEKNLYFHAAFKAEKDSVSMKIDHNTYKLMDNLKIDEIEVYGAPDDIHVVYLDYFTKFFDFQLNKSVNGNVLSITKLGLSLNNEFTLTWRQEDMSSKTDCNPEAFRGVDVLTRVECESRGCTYDDTHSQLPSCFMSQDSSGYKVIGTKQDTAHGFRYLLQHNGIPGPYSSDKNKDIEFLVFDVEMRKDNVLRFKFDDANSTERYKVPMTLDLGTSKAANPSYEVKVTSMDPFNFQVIRSSDGTALWDAENLIFSDQFIQITTALPSTYIYGFGENVHHSFRHDLRYQKWPMFSRDQPVPWGDHNNHYGVHPYYMCMEDSGKSHGVLLLNSNSQDYSFTPHPLLTYRTIGGILDFYMFLGPEPETVVQQYTGAIGRPYLPPYWSLGFQLCRYGYNNMTNLKAAVDRTKSAGIPHDVQYADIDHMDERKDFTVDSTNFPGLNDYFKSLQQDGIHIIIILDPALISNETNYEPYEKISAVKGSIMWAQDDTTVPENSTDSTGALLGYVWPKGKTVFPDFFKNATGATWEELIINHHSNNLTFDGLWIDMNEPANFGTNEDRPFNWPENERPYWSLNCSVEGSTIEHPPYRTMAAYVNDNYGKQHKAMLSDKTICLRAVQGELGQYKHYDVHSLYGWSQTLPTLEGLQSATGERGIVISRSTFPGSGKHAGHWLGDNDSNWEQLRLSVIGILEFNLFGIPYIGADICGFFGDTTPELCTRWMQLGAFYTFSRNHNELHGIPQDPAALGPDVANASRVVMETRYNLLPYLYTLFYKAHVEGNTVIRPMHHVFTSDKKTWSIDSQFMWGSALLIAPVLYQDDVTKDVYFPESRWFDYYTGEEMKSRGMVTVSAPLDHIPLYLHGGHIVPTQLPANTTVYSRRNPLGLMVVPDENGAALGELFWDDGDSIDTVQKKEYFMAKFNFAHNNITMTITQSHTVVSNLKINTIWVYGVESAPNQVTKNGVNHNNEQYKIETRMLIIKELQLPLTADFTVSWS